MNADRLGRPEATMVVRRWDRPWEPKRRRLGPALWATEILCAATPRTRKNQRADPPFGTGS